MTKNYADDGQRLTDCCGCYSTYHDRTLCCKKCWREVEHGQGDGSEYKCLTDKCYNEPIVKRSFCDTCAFLGNK